MEGQIMAARDKRIGGLSLSGFSKTAPLPRGKTKPESEPEPKIEAEPEAKPQVKVTKASASKAKKAPKEEKLITVNIKIRETQHQWLMSTARQVRDNNTDPVPASDRVYPQHLIQVAVDLLQSADLDWDEVKNAGDIRRALGLKD